MKSDTVSPMPKPVYSEELLAPLWLLAFIYFLFASLAISVWAALGNAPGLILIIFFTILTFYLHRKTALRIEISEGELRIGRAHIEIKYFGTISALDADLMRLTRGRDADPAAFLAIRFWQPRGVKIEIKDPRDPTPYWLISSKENVKLTQVLNDYK